MHKHPQKRLKPVPPRDIGDDFLDQFTIYQTQLNGIFEEPLSPPASTAFLKFFGCGLASACSNLIRNLDIYQLDKILPRFGTDDTLLSILHEVDERFLEWRKSQPLTDRSSPLDDSQFVPFLRRVPTFRRKCGINDDTFDDGSLATAAVHPQFEQAISRVEQTIAAWTYSIQEQQEPKPSGAPLPLEGGASSTSVSADARAPATPALSQQPQTPASLPETPEDPMAVGYEPVPSSVPEGDDDDIPPLEPQSIPPAVSR
ncbi:hypothetical protein PAPYR_17 [Paratrimastix pyriformis]|uniref:Uncharacterized protein n=1 Tax=Paratrimastix pyriformis TaxID=342808 RepID=A0ABQ8UYG8_9EUKA|nr:hypothetical protein PAPYR_17 [Paratrimastix pyriformis]